MEYEWIKSNRRTISAEIRNGRLIVRTPCVTKKSEVDDFLMKHRRWLEKNMMRAAAQKAAVEQQNKYTVEEIEELARQAARKIPERVAHFAPLVGVTYGRITIRNQRTRWGSCSAKGNLNFNCLLMLAPPEALDSVVVHELCHRKEMNHSERFYREVYRVMPDYDRWHRWLKEHGAELLARMN